MKPVGVLWARSDVAISDSLIPLHEIAALRSQ